MKKGLSLLIFSFFAFLGWGEEGFRVVSYNVENFFESKPDSSASKMEFSPQGLRRWTHKRYQTKLSQIAKALLASGEEVLPSLVGLCEVGEEKVLYDLTHFSPLKRLGYEYILAETRDVRHIHTALLYLPQAFRPLLVSSWEVDLSSFKYARPTRCILYVKGVVQQRDTLHVFVVHFPSRSGGILETEAYRVEAARRLSTLTDSIFSLSPQALVVAMGDFNDNPDEKSFQEGLNVLKIKRGKVPPQRLCLLREKAFHKSVEGSYKYHGVWYRFDQILLSSECLIRYKRREKSYPLLQVCDFDFLLTEDASHLGVRPFSTYYGMRYKRGFSDHLPIRVELYF